MLIIKNGTVIDPQTGFEGLADLWIKDGKIKSIVKKEELSKLGVDPDGICPDAPAMTEGTEKAEIIDATGLVVAPGLVDAHVHFRDPGFTYKEDILSGAKAAAKGGVTSVVLMANTKPVVDNVETLQYVLEKGKQTDIHVNTCCSITKGLQGQEMTNFDELLQAGAVGFTDDGIPIRDAELTRRALAESVKHDVLLSFHEEDPSFIENNGVNHGKASEYYGIGGSDRQAEISLIKRDLDLALETGGNINIQHISSKEGVELVRQAKKKSTKNHIHAEACPHHFSLTEEACIEYGTLAKMNPPLRTEEDRQAILAGLQDGTIDLIATDHAPHAAEEKAKPITEAPSGIIGLETSLPLAITNLVATKVLTMPQLFEKMSMNPAKLYHLPTGSITVGSEADLVIFDPNEEFVVGESLSKSQNSPFIGKTLKGVIYKTIVSGKVVYEK